MSLSGVPQQKYKDLHVSGKILLVEVQNENHPIFLSNNEWITGYLNFNSAIEMTPLGFHTILEESELHCSVVTKEISDRRKHDV